MPRRSVMFFVMTYRASAGFFLALIRSRTSRILARFFWMILLRASSMAGRRGATGAGWLEGGRRVLGDRGVAGRGLKIFCVLSESPSYQSDARFTYVFVLGRNPGFPFTFFG